MVSILDESGLFRSVPDNREPYTIVIPPPNVTGVLHMGHMLNNSLQDVLIRRARMLVSINSALLAEFVYIGPDFPFHER